MYIDITKKYITFYFKIILIFSLHPGGGHGPRQKVVFGLANYVGPMSDSRIITVKTKPGNWAHFMTNDS